MILGSIAVEEALLVLKIVFLVLLYLFIWRIVRSATRDLRLPQESFILAPSREGGIAAARPPVHSGRLVVNRLSMDDYLRGVVPLEIGSRTDAEFAAVQAQAVAARTYAYKHLNPGRAFDM